MITTADERIMRHVEAWPGDGGSGGGDGAGPAGMCRQCLAEILEGRAAYLDRPDPTRWRRGDVRAVLYDLCVPRLSEHCDLTAHAVASLDAYLDFLDRSGRLHPGSTAVRHLRQELRQQAPGFAAAMADRSRFRMAKTLYQAMLSDGVDTEDDDAVDAWTAAFSRAPEPQRAAVLEHLLAGQPELLTARFIARRGKVAALAPEGDVADGETGGEVPDSSVLLPPDERLPEVLPSFAPVRVPSRAEAARAARRSPLLRRLLALASWLAVGRKVTKDGEPVPADIRELAAAAWPMEGRRTGHLDQTPNLRELFWLARRLELVDLRRDALVAGPRLAPWLDGDAPDDDVLDLWRDVMFLVETGQEVPDEAPRGGGTLGEAMRRTGELVPALVVALYRVAAVADATGEGQGGLPLEPLLDDRVGRLMGDRGAVLRSEDQELLEVTLRMALATTLVRLGELGLLEACTPTLTVVPEEGEGRTGEGFLAAVLVLARAEDVTVQLTPLGRWAVNQALRAEGAEAPAVEEPAVEEPARPVVTLPEAVVTLSETEPVGADR